MLSSSLQLKIRPSKLLALGYLMLFLSSLVVIWYLPLSWWLCLLLAGIVTGYFQYIFRCYVLLAHSRSVRILEIRPENQVKLYLHSDNWLPATLKPTSLHTGSLIILLLKTSKKIPISVVLMRDSVSSEDFSRLSMALFNST